MRAPGLVFLSAALFLPACGDDSGGGGGADGGMNADGGTTIDAPRAPDGPPVVCDPVAGTPDLELEEVPESFTNPVLALSPPADNRLFVVEQAGIIRIVGRSEPFLDITGMVQCCGEEGLLGLAFHPEYGGNRRFFVYYIDNGSDIQIDEFTTSASDPDVADMSSRRAVLGIEHRLTSTGENRDNHNGGMLAFGRDGYLYISTGDGGSGDDPDENGQNTSAFLGKLLRIDVDSTGAGNYGIPPGNPLGNEMWAYGLRNPWRFTVDRTTGDLYIGDVGQERIEEIDVAPSGMADLNFGWDIYEGTLCHEETVAACVAPPSGGGPPNDPGKVWPILEADRNEAGAIIGGYVYRGCRLPGYDGTYFYGYHDTGRVFSLRWESGSATAEREWTSLNAGGTLSAFGQDYEGELYVLAYGPGILYKIVPAQ